MKPREEQLTDLRECLHTYWLEGVLGILGYRDQCTHNSIRERNRPCANGGMRRMPFRTNLDDGTNEFDGLFFLHGMLIVAA